MVADFAKQVLGDADRLQRFGAVGVALVGKRYGVIQSALPQEAYFAGSHKAYFRRNDKMKTVEKPHRIAICGEYGLDVHRLNLYDYYELAWGEFPV